MRRITIVLLLITFLTTTSLSACGTPDPKYGREFNEERKKIGIPIILDNWVLDRTLSGQARWVNPERIEKRNKRIPVHWSKKVNYRTGTLMSEADLYYGREDYTTWDGSTFREKLQIMYFYQPDPYHYMEKSGWRVTLTVSQERWCEEISLEEAERILEEWGIERLNYEFPPND